MRDFWKKALAMAAIGFAVGILVGLGFLLPYGIGKYYAQYGAGRIALHLGLSGLVTPWVLGSCVVIYFIIWLIMYLRGKRQVRRINEALRTWKDAQGDE